MNRLVAYSLGLVALLGASIPAFGQLYGGDSIITATPEQLEECKRIGIPEFTCDENSILAKRRMIAAEQAGAYGSGTPMLGTTFGEMGALVGVLGAVFGGVAAAFFAMSRRRHPETVTK